MKVRAIRDGFIYNTRMKAGTVFELLDEKHRGKWMVDVPDDAVDHDRELYKDIVILDEEKQSLPDKKKDFVQHFQSNPKEKEPPKAAKKVAKKKVAKKAKPPEPESSVEI